MLTHGRRARALPIALFLAIGAMGCQDEVQTPLEPSLALEGAGSGHFYRPLAFEVYTQNLYLGGDTGPLFTLDFNDIGAVLAATNVFWQDVQASDVPGRMREIVDEIDRNRPEVVGMQEVLRFVLLDGAFQPIGGIDLLAAVEAEIAARGLPYRTEVVQETTSSTLPLGFDPGTGQITRWLNFTDRVVALRRTDVELVGTDHGLYAARIPLGPLDILRGWVRLSVRHRGTLHHLVSTHLETQAVPPVQAAQAAELRAAVVAGLEGVTVIAGDLNSNAAAMDGDPTWTPTYGDLVADGFIDVWETAPHRRRNHGLTCCHDPSLLGDLEFSQRIDFVLVRSSGDEHDRWGDRRLAFFADIVGEEHGDETTSGLWPSDHAGLVAGFRLPWRLR